MSCSFVEFMRLFVVSVCINQVTALWVNMARVFIPIHSSLTRACQTPIPTSPEVIESNTLTMFPSAKACVPHLVLCVLKYTSIVAVCNKGCHFYCY